MTGSAGAGWEEGGGEVMEVGAEARSAPYAKRRRMAEDSPAAFLSCTPSRPWSMNHWSTGWPAFTWGMAEKDQPAVRRQASGTNHESLSTTTGRLAVPRPHLPPAVRWVVSQAPGVTYHTSGTTRRTPPTTHQPSSASGPLSSCLTRARGGGRGGRACGMSILPAKPAPPGAEASCTVASSSTGAPASGTSGASPPCFGGEALARGRVAMPLQGNIFNLKQRFVLS